MEEEEIRRKLKEIEEKKKTFSQGRREFSEGMELLNKEETELRKELELKRKENTEEQKVERFDKKIGGLLGGGSGDIRSYVFYGILVLVIFIAAIALRTTLLKYWGFYEPDDFYHYSVIRAAVNNNFFIPLNLSISGWPQHTEITEPRGLYWVTLAPYFFLRFVGISYYNVERYIALVFGMLDVIGAYFLARLLSKDKFFLLLVMTLVALSAGDAARTSALIYRGDSFVTIFLIATLVFLIYIFKSKELNRKIMFMVLSGFSLGLATFVWNGATFATIIFLLSLGLIEMVAFVRSREDMLEDSIFVIGAFFIWFILTSLMLLTGQVIGYSTPIFVGKNFALVFGLLLVSWLAGRYILQKKYLPRPLLRFGVLVIAILALFGLAWLLDSSLIINVLVNNGVIVTTAFSATIQELTPPTYNFLFASFGYALYTNPMSILMTLPSVMLGGVPAISSAREFYAFVFWIFMLLGFIPYLFMRVYDSGGFLNGNARLRFSTDVEMMVIMTYFAITGLLQIYAIRFNSLVAVPLAIFGAYTIYWIVLFMKRFEISKYIGPLVVFAVSTIILASVIGTEFGSSILIDVGAFVLSLVIAGILYVLIIYTKRYELVGYAIVILLIIGLVYYDIIFSATIAPADTMNTNMFNALSWLKNNSASNSVVLTLWPDGSVVEGVANRTSITDSVGAQNLDKADPFAQWILNSSDDPQFLEGPNESYPNYLVTRYVWLYGETSGIFQESGLNASTEQTYAFAPLTSFNEAFNSTAAAFRFSNNQGLDVVAILEANNTLKAYLQSSTGSISPFTYIALSDATTGNFSIARQTSFGNVTNNQMLIIQYSDIPNPSFRFNITGALILAPGIAQSNMVKFLFFCGYNGCEWDNSNASLKMVYANSDTRIFKITYNTTS